MQTICAIVCIYSLSCFFRYIFRYFNLKDLKKMVFRIILHRRNSKDYGEKEN